MSGADGPLRPEELAEIESCLLPALERHHLRLLAHGLRTFQQIAGGPHGPVPSAEALDGWAASQPLLAADPPFARSFLEQLRRLGGTLEALAREQGVEPLALQLADLSAWARRQAEERLAAESPEPLSPPAPPG
ncbi:MAG: hypothetical protein ACKO5F_08140 [Synechococcus sp.]